MPTVRRRGTARRLLVALCLWLGALGAAAAAPPPKASTTLQALIGEYRSDSHTITLYESAGALFLNGAGAVAVRLHAVGRFTYSAGDGRQLNVGSRSALAQEVQWEDAAFKRYDLGAERVAAVRARVSTDAGTLRAAALAARPPAESHELRPLDLVSLVDTIPHVKLDIKYATTDNFIGLPLYATAGAYLQRPAASALAAVARSLASQGLGLVIFDAYRPWFVTKMFWDAVPPEAHVFVADPSQGSKHNRGCAVDLSLYDLKTGAVIEMTGRYDEMSPRSYADYGGGTSRERWFRDLLRQEMQARGFQVYPEEWWHFDYRDWHNYPLGNQAFENLPVTTRE